MKVRFNYNPNVVDLHKIVEFDDLASNEEIEETFNDWVRDLATAYWETVPEKTNDAYENWF